VDRNRIFGMDYLRSLITLIFGWFIWRLHLGVRDGHRNSRRN
jgi:hypothetical protein